MISITSNTSITSINGVVLISDTGSPSRRSPTLMAITASLDFPWFVFHRPLSYYECNPTCSPAQALPFPSGSAITVRHEDRHMERELGQRAPARRAGCAEDLRGRCLVPAGDQVHRREVSARGDRGARLQLRGVRP